MTKTMNRRMNKTVTAACAAAAFCCACAASYTAILSVLGAMIMASIIICGSAIGGAAFLYTSGNGGRFHKPTKRRTKT